MFFKVDLFCKKKSYKYLLRSLFVDVPWEAVVATKGATVLTVDDVSLSSEISVLPNERGNALSSIEGISLD